MQATQTPALPVVLDSGNSKRSTRRKALTILAAVVVVGTRGNWITVALAVSLSNSTWFFAA